MTYDDFRAVMKNGDYNALYLFSGPETFLQEFCALELKKSLIDPSFEDFNYKCYLEAPVFEDVNAFITALPLMSAKKLVVFNNCHLFERKLSEKARWAEMFSSLPPYVVCVVRETDAFSKEKTAQTEVKKAVVGCGQSVVFDYLPDARLRPWLMKAAAVKGKSLSQQNASYMISSVGRSMTTLRAEIEKISAKAEEFEITRQDIDSVIIKPLTETVFKLIDALLISRADLCFASISKLSAMETEPIAALSTIGSQVLKIYTAKLLLLSSMSVAEVKKRLGGGFGADKAVSNASKTTEKKLERMISFLRQAEKGIKNGEKNAWAELYILAAQA